MKIEIKKGELTLNIVDLTNEVTLLENASLTFLIGRSEDCTIQIDDPKISREQGELNFNAGIWKIKNISPSVPMSLNGVVVKESEISPDDIVSFAKFNLIFSFISTVAKTIAKENATDVVSQKTENDANSMAMTETAIDAIDDRDDTDKVEVAPVSEEFLPQPEQEVGNEEGFIGEGEGEAEVAAFDTLENAAPSSFAEDSNDLNQVTSDSPTEVPSEFSNDMSNMPAETDTETEDGTKVFRAFAKFELELFGELAPYDRYPLDLAETYIGRDTSKCQIVLNDDEVSSVHAVIRKNYVTCLIEDLDSSNGTLLNGSRIKKGELTNGDEFLIGSTTFTVRVVSDLIKSEDERLMPLQTQQEVEIEEIVEVHVDDEDDAINQGISLHSEGDGQDSGPAEKSIIKRLIKDFKDPVKRKKIIYGLVGVVLLLMFIPESDDTGKDKPKDKKKTEGSQEAKTDEGKEEKPQIAGEIKKKERVLTEAEKGHLNQTYELAKNLHSVGKYGQAIMELDKIFAVTSDFKDAKSLKESAKEGLARLEENERKKREEEERLVRLLRVKELVEKAKESTKERNLPVSEALFSQILSLDPENFDVPQLKIEIEAWKKEQDRIALDKAQKEGDRKRRVSQLQPGKNYFLQKEWFKAISALEEFMKISDMDEDLIKEGQTMLEESKSNLSGITGPILGKARSMKEGQDLKGAYENYMQVLAFDPISVEALEETSSIRELLNMRAKKVYREAIISESLSLFSDAKEKFQEVQQISPSDSDYYKKSSDKLKDYLE